MTVRLHTSSLSLLILVLSASTSMASEPDEGASGRTLLIRSAEAEMAAGRYSQAAQEFDAAYRIEPSGPLCLKSARANLLAGHLIDARERYYTCIEATDLPPKERREASVALLDIQHALKAKGVTIQPQSLSPNAPTVHPKVQRKPPPRDKRLKRAALAAPAAPNTYPLRYTHRPLTLPGGTWSVAGGVGLGGSQESEQLSLGLTAATSYGIVDAFELGAFVMQLQLLERVVYDRPSLYAIAEFFRGDRMSVGGKVEVTAGIQSYSPWTVAIGLPQAYYVTDFMRIDLGLYVVFIMNEERLTNLHVPGELQFQLSDAIFGSLMSGLILSNGDELVLPFGANLGYTFERDEQPLCDLRAGFQWPLFLQPDSSRGTDIETFTAEVSVRCYLAH